MDVAIRTTNNMDGDGKNDNIGCGDDGERGYLVSWKGNANAGRRSGACSRSRSRSVGGSASRDHVIGDKRTSMRKSALRVVHSGKIK
jgi:hypothetical protein